MFTETDAPMKSTVMARRCACQHERPTLKLARGILRAEMNEHADRAAGVLPFAFGAATLAGSALARLAIDRHSIG